MSLVRIAIVIALCASGAACTGGPAGQQYELSGQVLAVRPERREVVIRHDDIKGFMPGMTMPFKVREARWLTVATPGEIVEARLVLDEGGAYLSEIRPTGRREPLPETIDAPGAVDLPVAEGDEVPNVALRDQRGRAFSLHDLRGAPVALTFTYTRCPLPAYCPAQDRRFAALQEAIGQQPGLARARLLSISIDPDYDRPEVLAEHAERLGADPSIWRLATGGREAILSFASSLALSVVIEEPGSADLVHALRTAVIDRDGRLIRRYDGTAWQVRDVLRDLADGL